MREEKQPRHEIQPDVADAIYDTPWEPCGTPCYVRREGEIRAYLLRGPDQDCWWFWDVYCQNSSESGNCFSLDAARLQAEQAIARMQAKLVP